MVGTFAHISPYLLGAFMFALACVPLVFVLHDSQRRSAEKKRMAQLRHEARIAAELHGRGAATKPGMVEDWAGQGPR